MSAAAINRDTVLLALAGHIGAERAIHARFLVREITGESDHMDLRLRTLRRTIAELRAEGHHICGHPATGYYIAADEAEINRTCTWLYARSMTTLQQVAAMKRVSLPDLRGQLRLPYEAQSGAPARSDGVRPPACGKSPEATTRTAPGRIPPLRRGKALLRRSGRPS